MEFWGVEVKAGQPLKVKPDNDKILHLSQVVLGEGKKDKGNESVTIFLKVGNQKLVLGILSPEKFPQLSYDLVFEKEFELSHNWKNGSLHFCGYQSYVPEGGEDFYDSDYSSEEQEATLPLNLAENGKPGRKVEETKNVIAKAGALKTETSEKPKVKLVEPSKNNNDEDEESDDDESDEEDSDDESDEDMDDAESDDVDDDDESDEEDDEETPKKDVQGKKRPNESATKTPVSLKKAKTDTTPQKTDGKKGGHTATPHPAKKAGKSPNSAKTLKSGGHSCGSCNKTFNSDAALKSHNKAKHGGN